MAVKEISEGFAAALATLNSKFFFNNDAVETPLMVKNVSCGDLEPLWLMAQSVPSASLVPCVQLLPVGWSVAGVAVNNGRSVITLDHDRAGKAAVVVKLTTSCDLAGAVEVTSEQPGARRYLRIDRSAPGSRPPARTPSQAAVSPRRSARRRRVDSS